MNRPESGADLRIPGRRAASRRLTVPRATYRLQLNRRFDFDAAAAQVPYLSRLGISHVYTSPILCARAGSSHGYDVVDPTRVNPELGGEEGLRRLVACLRDHGMGLLADVVPNHLAVAGDDNAWWLDVLEWGRESIYAGFFDIDWDVPDPDISGRVLAPFLGGPFGEAVAGGDVRLRYDEQNGRLYFRVHEAHRFPLAPAPYAALMRGHGAALAENARAFRGARSKGARSARRAAFDAACQALKSVYDSDAAVRAAMQELIEAYSPGTPEGLTRLLRLLDRQHYRLAWWRTAADEINWRRFFDVTDLAGLRMQDNAVFEAVNATIFRLYRDGLIDGVRVDHVDGLADPRTFCRKLRRRLDALDEWRPEALPRGPAYLVVEKILAPGEKLARDWRTDGTSGYVFMNEVSAVLHDSEGREPLAALWRMWSGQSADFGSAEQEARRRIPQHLFSADFNACAHALHQVARSDPMTRDWSLAAVRRCLTEMLVHFPVYRTYADARGRSQADGEIMAQVVAHAKRSCRPAERGLLDLMDRWLGGEPVQKIRHAEARRRRLRAVARFQQLTSPVAAKSVEDTAFYRFGVLLSRNEVGANPGQFAMDPQDFHAACGERLSRYSAAMLATATHDHKRGEDLRARLAVLSEIPRRWAETVRRWRLPNEALKREVGETRGPDPTDEYVLYQMLVGAWPLDLRIEDRPALDALCARLNQWQRKAVREAKRRSGWVEPNLAYEQACEEFLRRLLDPEQAPLFLAELLEWVGLIAAPGALNGLVQTLLRLTTPGVPDTYQGTELWDFSLVDPDNRREVDFDLRARALEEPVSDMALLAGWRDGRVKQQLIARALALRSRLTELFNGGSYVPLRARGSHARHVLAFVREFGGHTVVVAVPLRTMNLRVAPGDREKLGLPDAVWDGTVIELPARCSHHVWWDALARRPIGGGRVLHAGEIFGHWPLALLHS